MRGPSIHLGEHNFGMYRALDFALAFLTWADAQREVTVEAIRERWGVSRATAFRWRLSYRTHVEQRDARKEAA